MINPVLLIFAAILFIASIIVFVVGQLMGDKQKSNEEAEPDEAETPKWMRVFAMIGFALAAVCLLAGVGIFQ